jgi:hypothetical protein
LGGCGYYTHPLAVMKNPDRGDMQATFANVKTDADLMAFVYLLFDKREDRT